MKSRLLGGLVLTLFLLLGSSMKSNAQITGVTVDSAFAWTQTNCLLPSVCSLDLMGNITGTPPALDSVTVYINWGDGTDTTFKVSTAQMWFWTNLSHTYTFPGTFSAMVAATTSNGLTDTIYSNNLTLTNTCSPLAGRLYSDANSNCTYDAGEIVLAGRTVKFHDNGTSMDYYAFTDNAGMYYYGVPPGNYTISVPYVPAGLTPLCPSSGSVTLAVSGSTTITNDFAFTCSSSAAVDLSVYASAWNWRIGFDRPVTIMVQSTNACTNSSGTLTVTLPAGLSYSGVMGGFPAPTVSGSTLTWNVTNLSAVTTWMSNILVYTATSVNLGDTLCVTATITPSVPDANAANNTYTLCAEANNSFDPNDKNVTPRGTGATGDILNGTELTYLINFQNTGNDVAYNVTVKDIIDADLDISSFRVLKSSHTMSPFINGNEVSFRFDNINLPDSGANEPASHGYIIYKIKPKAGLAMGTQIQNTANIYFDYNDAIITNTTLNTIATPQSIQHLSSGTMSASVYPNPASGNIYIDVNEKENYKAELYDMLGRNVKTIESASGMSIMNINEIPAGMYFLKLTNAANKVLSTKINIQH